MPDISGESGDLSSLWFLRHAVAWGAVCNSSSILKLVINMRLKSQTKFIGITLPETNMFVLCLEDEILFWGKRPIFGCKLRVTWTNTAKRLQLTAFGKWNLLPKAPNHQQVVEMINPRNPTCLNLQVAFWFYKGDPPKKSKKMVEGDIKKFKDMYI